MISLAALALGGALYSAAPAPLAEAAQATTSQEPPQVDDLVNVSGAPYTFYLSQDVLPHRTCMVFNDTTSMVGTRSGRMINDIIPAGPSCCWVLSGVLRTDSNGDHYVRAYATVNGELCEVADYGGFEIFECTNGYQIMPTTTPGTFIYDTNYPGDPWVAYASWNAGEGWEDW